MIIFCECMGGDFYWSTLLNILLPCSALIVSIIALRKNIVFADRNTRLTIQQALFKTVAEKAKDCNLVWESEQKAAQNPESPYAKAVTELIISMQVIGKAFVLFGKNYKAIKQELEDEYDDLFWKQLHPELRKWLRDSGPGVGETAYDNKYYKRQVADIINRFKKYFDPIINSTA